MSDETTATGQPDPTTPIPERLEVVQAELRLIFTDIHTANDDSRQAHAHMREAVSATSAAIAAIQRAHKHAVNAWPQPDGGAQ